MRIAFYDTHQFDREAFEKANESYGYDISWIESRLTQQTALLAKDHQVVCSFVEDSIDEKTTRTLKNSGIKMIALRCAGFNHVDLKAIHENEISISRVPEYSPHAIAEHTIAMILCLNRKIHKSYQRVRDCNFSLEGLVGFDLFKKTVGIIGTGKIGTQVCKILTGFGCNLLASDLSPSQDLMDLGVQYTDLNSLLSQSDIISLHLPLNEQTHHLISTSEFKRMKQGAYLINTSRGGLIETAALIDSLKTQKLGAVGLDVYEEEEGIFFKNLSTEIMQDDLLARLLTFPNVLITSHQGFLTAEALTQIAQITLENIKCFALGKKSGNEIKYLETTEDQ